MVIDMSNPFVSGITSDNTAATTEQELAEFREYAYDFDTNKFLYDKDGNHLVVKKDAALKTWIYKCLMTERYRYRAYFDDYGCELEQFIGTTPNDTGHGSTLYKYVEDSLLVNPYIKSVKNITVDRDGADFTMTVGVTTIYGSTEVKVEV